MSENIEIQEKKLVTMSNEIVRARWSPLTVSEMRVLWVVMGQMPPVSKDNPDSYLQEIDPKKPYYITKDDFVRLGCEPKNVARDIRAACSDLKSKSVFVPTPFGELEIGWIDSVLHFKSSVFEELKKKYPNSKYDEEFLNQLRLHNLLETLPKVMQSDENLVARVTLSERIIPYIAKMRENYTKLGFDEVAGFTSFYTFKLFFVLMQFRDEKTHAGEVFYNVEQFRHDFDLKDKYKQTRDMIKYVITPSLAEIEEKTDFKIKFVTCHGKNKAKGTQKITNFHFSFKKVAPAALAAKSAWQEKGLSDKQINKLKYHAQVFCDANNDLMHPDFRGGYDDLIEEWRPMLKDPATVSKFAKIQELLDR